MKTSWKFGDQYLQIIYVLKNDSEKNSQFSIA